MGNIIQVIREANKLQSQGIVRVFEKARHPEGSEVIWSGERFKKINGKWVYQGKAFQETKDVQSLYSEHKWDLRNSEKNVLMFVDVDRLLQVHSQDQPSYDILKKENQIGNRVVQAEDFLKKNLHTDISFLPSSVYVENGKISFEDGRHRVLAAKNLGIKKVAIEVSKEQVKKIQERLENKGEKENKPVLFDRPEMQSPVWKVNINGKDYFIQSYELPGGSSAWQEVTGDKKKGWTPVKHHAVYPFEENIGDTKQEAIDFLKEKYK